MGAGNSKENLHDAINAENTMLITQILKVFLTLLFHPQTLIRNSLQLSMSQLAKRVI